MKKRSVLFVIIGIISFTGLLYMPLQTKDSSAINFQMMSSMMQSGMMCSMMSPVPEDVIIKVKSPQLLPTKIPSKVILQVLDKDSGKPLENSRVIIGIEEGASVTTMRMTGTMLVAKEIGNGLYSVNVFFDESGFYTLHTHVIPPGKSMHSMMTNHLDIGFISK